MNWKTSWVLVTVAVFLLGYIMLVERQQPTTHERARAAALLLNFQAEKVDSIQLLRTNEVVVHLNRTNGHWSLSHPLTYPVDNQAVVDLLQTLLKMDSQTYIPPETLEEKGQTLADYGLAKPRAALVLKDDQTQTEIHFGTRSAVGDLIYARVPEQPGLHAVASVIDQFLTAPPDAWRSAVVMDIYGFRWDRLDVRTPASGYTIAADRTNRTFVLSKPTPARVDLSKVEVLFRNLQATRVLRFIEDDPQSDLESYGLLPPALELTLGLGTNDLHRIQFGTSPTNNPAVVHARLMDHTNVVLLPSTLLESLRTTHSELRERRLLALTSTVVDTIEMIGMTNAVLTRQGGTNWMVTGAESFPADTRLVNFFFRLVGQLEGEVERDVPTDLATFGLDQPSRTFRWTALATNDLGQVTNRLVAQLDFGTIQEDKVFVTRHDETTVYSVSRAAFEQLPREAWQMRNRTVWQFSTNDVRKLTIRMPERTVEMNRTGPGDWELAPGSQGVINDLAVEEAVFRLGNLQAEFWLARGTNTGQAFGIGKDSYSIKVEGVRDSQPMTHLVQFGPDRPNQFPVAQAEMDGQTVVFEFPKKLHFELVRDLMLPFLNKPSNQP